MICQQIRAFIGRSRASEAGTWHRLPRKICGDLSLPLSFKDGARNAAFPAIRVFEIVPPQPRGGIGHAGDGLLGSNPSIRREQTNTIL